MKTYRIHIIRHGVTEGNEQGRYIGRTDLPLTSDSINSLELLRENYDYPHGSVYFVSPLMRCIQTLHALYPGKDAFEVPGLIECDFGEWEQKSTDDLYNSPEFIAWIQSGRSSAPPGGESTAQFAERVCSTFEKLVDGLLRGGIEDSVIVTHGGTIMTLLAAYGLPQAPFYDWMCDPGYGYSLRIMPNLWMAGRKLEVYDTIPQSIQNDDF